MANVTNMEIQYRQVALQGTPATRHKRKVNEEQDILGLLNVQIHTSKYKNPGYRFSYNSSHQS